MGRVERFREIRISRRKFRLSFLFFFLLVITGLCVVDYSVNSIMKNEYSVEFVSLEREGSSLYSLNIFDHKIYINTEYVEKDFRRIKSAINSILGLK
ncbi:hypothetical protein CDQ84_07610 [Clostridium thermosuccinogenes]|jgi:hypothetical protein|uniref:Uncharacterized protein n=1 Tax=Clostridium thermosuccinogenes TaxID=84032 RepID=A0A2K2F3K9_9CLOT|nr:hypothetical protein [Pseudoclostridium thermosuccinogenes]AUS95924.1 hypothetical protein CDO33_05395 [Pseudoclostridium thermosuccinogenes]PNT93362.1 hypothetical protein CDQ83_07580 [Pseudoclostridium thermosuccinogenes]PNT97889.1 hypothetical protein CDQ85_07110 [Pseudoclostridium thermosuccinogenes]PNT99821.1 hypothetical protein CDQ84_07610 [Pseudoclostridium thermosuccinogenes]